MSLQNCNQKVPLNTPWVNPRAQGSQKAPEMEANGTQLGSQNATMMDNLLRRSSGTHFASILDPFEKHFARISDRLMTFFDIFEPTNAFKSHPFTKLRSYSWTNPRSYNGGPAAGAKPSDNLSFVSLASSVQLCSSHLVS